MSSQHPTPNNPSTQHPDVKAPQHKDALPLDGTSGKYRNKNLPKPMYFHQAVYVLSYEGSAWPNSEPYDGILGVYTSLENAQRAGSRWLKKQPGLRSDRSVPSETRFSEWKADEGDEEWEKGRAESGMGFLESRLARIKRCEVRMDSSLPYESNKDEGGKKDEGDDEDEGGEKKGQQDPEDDEPDGAKERREASAVEGMKRLAV